MTVSEFESKISKTISDLSDPLSYRLVCHEHILGEPLPSIVNLKRVINLVREILFPGYFGNTSLRTNTTQHYMGVHVDELFELLSGEILAGMCFECIDENENKTEIHQEKAKDIALEFITCLPEIRKILVTDVEATYLNDPAARNVGEVIFCYPAIRAITNYRMAHKLLELGVPLLPRFISEMAHSETGIDIHPQG